MSTPTVLIVSQAACEPATAALPKYHVITPPDDPDALQGRDVVLWPDAETDSREDFARLAAVLLPIAGRLRAVDTRDVNSGWGIHSAVAEGWDGKQIIAWAKPRIGAVDRLPEAEPEPAKVPPGAENLPPALLSELSYGLIPGTDLAFGHRLYQRHGKDLHYTVERGWLVWSGQRWQINDKAVAVAALAMESAKSLFDDIKESTSQSDAFKLAKLACQKRSIEASIWLTRAEDGIYQQLITFDADPMILNVHNGVVNLRTGKLQPHAREARCTMLAGTHYDPQATAPRWRQFIGEVCCDNVELMDYMQRVCGYLLTASVREHCLFFMHGAGRNGKSVLVEAIMRVMGDYAWAAEPEMLMAKKHLSIPVDIAALRGKRAVFLNETGQGQRFDEAKLKNLTGGDRLQARFMRENLFEFDPTHKLVLRGNHEPTVNGTDEGIWSRLKLIPFDLRLDAGDLDRRLPETLQTELPGILAWAVEGCLMWQAEGLQPPAIIEQAVADYRGESNTLGRFVDEKCTLKTTAQVKSSALYKAYRSFCEEGGERYLSQKDFPHELAHRNPLIKRERLAKGMMFSGIELVQTESAYGRYERINPQKSGFPAQKM